MGRLIPFQIGDDAITGLDINQPGIRLHSLPLSGTSIGFCVKCPLLLPILAEIGMGRKILIKLTVIKCHGKSFSSSKVVTWDRKTHKRDEANGCTSATFNCQRARSVLRTLYFISSKGDFDLGGFRSYLECSNSHFIGWQIESDAAQSPRTIFHVAEKPHSNIQSNN